MVFLVQCLIITVGIEVKIMKRFLRDTPTITTTLPDDFRDEFLEMFPKYMQTSRSLLILQALIQQPLVYLHLDGQ